MDKEKIRDIIYITVAILLSIFAIKVLIWLLPVIIVAILAYFIYKSMRKKDFSQKWEEPKNKKQKNKKIVIIDEENND